MGGVATPLAGVLLSIVMKQYLFSIFFNNIYLKKNRLDFQLFQRWLLL